MTDETHQLDTRTRRYLSAARAVLTVEAFIASLWIPVVLVAGFIAAALLGIPQSFPAWIHAVGLLALGAALAISVRSGLRRFRQPTQGAAMRRLEQDSGLGHRPFAAILDQPAADAGDAERSLWRIYVNRRRLETRRLRLRLPRPGLAPADPMALRMAVMLTLVLAVVIAGPRAGNLVTAALEPSFSTVKGPPLVDAWIKPPAYTGLSPILLKPDMDKPIAVPVGSKLEAHVTSGSSLPHLTIGDDRQDFAKLPGGGFVVSSVLDKAGTVRVRRGWSTLAHWQINIVPDQPPAVSFANLPVAMPSGALRIDYQASDDYGVTSIMLKVRLVPRRHHVVADPIAAMLTSGLNEKELRGTSFQDLTSHPWAGMPVLAKLVATDAAGHTGESEEATLTLPEHSFQSAVARDIIDARKQLILEEAPRRDIAIRVAAVAYRPETYSDDLSVFLALRTAADELRRRSPDDDNATAEIEALLWDAALKIDEGDRPEAEKNLRAAEEALDKALRDPSTPASEIARLTKNLKEAIDREMEAVAENLRKKLAAGEKPEDMQMDQNTRALDRKDLADQVDKMQQMAQQGSREAAQDMLNYIESLLENLKAGMKPGQKNAQGEKALNNLKDLAQKQRDLMNGQNSDKSAADAQESLRQQLGDEMRDLDSAMGSIPKALGGADRAMRNATKSLQRGAKGGAHAQQEEAAGQLDEAVHSLSDQLSEDGMTEKKGEGRGDRDPFGRARFDPGNSVKVPTERELQKSRDILDELRRRAGEHNRPRYELDYIDRLLKQF
ncbi:MAG TPA: DUF4175 family protein [Alphaproteobacteria bacterium]|nr:DUF4175 family protein [Alphaproteobacteria bacterium]